VVLPNSLTGRTPSRPNVQPESQAFALSLAHVCFGLSQPIVRHNILPISSSSFAYNVVSIVSGVSNARGIAWMYEVSEHLQPFY
jgi:hypothetical protein